ncbi:hypothetical protein CRG98_015342 [Punica granatum]|uniref:Uncharacterized protein n=1 Tax=Punica granatum TaxID=22663 RepID=A0A2I0K6T7_PUNGR|nr:hypothetical protein CRG98_015342 [Punica granatum]
MGFLHSANCIPEKKERESEIELGVPGSDGAPLLLRELREERSSFEIRRGISSTSIDPPDVQQGPLPSKPSNKGPDPKRPQG